MGDVAKQEFCVLEGKEFPVPGAKVLPFILAHQACMDLLKKAELGDFIITRLNIEMMLLTWELLWQDLMLSKRNFPCNGVSQKPSVSLWSTGILSCSLASGKPGDISVCFCFLMTQGRKE